MGKYVERGKAAPHKVAKDDPRAIALLKEDHHIFRQLFDKAEAADGPALVAVARELCMRLSVHMTIEEEIFYPALSAVVDKEEINEGIVEHETGKAIVTELEQLDGSEELFKTKIHVLGEVTMHHVDEEDSEMFADAKEAHRDGRIDLDQIGARLDARQAELFGNIAKTGDEGKTGDAVANEVETIAK